MRPTKKIAKSIVRWIRQVVCAAIEAPAIACYFAADLLEEGLDAAERIGDHVERKIEEIDKGKDDEFS